MDALIKTIEELKDPTAQFMLEMMEEMSTGGMGGMGSMGVTPKVRLFARDAAAGVTTHAMANIMSMTLPVSLSSDTLCSMMPVFFSQMGFTVEEKQCGLLHEGLEGGRFTTLGKIGETDFRQYMYFYLSGKELWIVSLGVEDAAWAAFEPTFGEVAESFAVLP